MTNLLIVLYALSIIFFALSERVKNYIKILSLQGLLLFGIEFFSIDKLHLFEMIFILAETIVVKAIVIPIFLNRVRKKNQLKREHEPFIPVFYSIVIAVIVIFLSFVMSNQLKSTGIHTQFFTIAFASVIFGMYFIIIHKNIFTHVVGYLILENGIFLLSLAVGNTMPMMVNLAVLFDVFLGVLILGIFVNRVGNTFNSVEINQLSNLKD
jgi:hydrogenase-4 component E